MNNVSAVVYRQAAACKRLLLAVLAASIFTNASNARAFEDPAASHAKLTVILPTERSFDALAEQSFPGLTGTDQYALLKKGMVLLKNIGGAPAKAYSLQWDIVPLETPAYTVAATYMSRYTQPRFTDTSIAPGETRLVSTLFNLGTKNYGSADAFQSSSGNALAAELRTISSVSVKIDGTISIDNYFEGGADATHIHELYRCVRNADHDELLYLSKTLIPHASSEDILKQLDADMARAKSTNGAGPQAMYLHARAESIDALTAFLERNGSTAFLEKLYRLTSAMTNSSYSHMTTWQ